jgi:predicted MPP superfamily phosphohydrolase
VQWLQFIGNMRRAVTFGGLLPGRPSKRAAPGGSTIPRLRAPLSVRLSEEHRWYQFTEHDLTIPDLVEPVTILHLTDVHIRALDADLLEICRRLREVRPDLVLITGDVVTRGWTEEAVTAFLDALPPARLGRFAIMGNWEYWAEASPAPWAARLARHGVTLLRDQWEDIGPFVLAGTDDQWAGTPDPEGLLAALPLDRPVVMMTHSPDLFPRLIDPRVRLVLAGHTHGGQVRLPGIGALWSPRGTGPFVGGWYQQGDTHLFVSRGLGWSVAPLRLYCPPEFAWLRLSPG